MASGRWRPWQPLMPPLQRPQRVQTHTQVLVSLAVVQRLLLMAPLLAPLLALLPHRPTRSSPSPHPLCCDVCCGGRTRRAMPACDATGATACACGTVLLGVWVESMLGGGCGSKGAAGCVCVTVGLVWMVTVG